MSNEAAGRCMHPQIFKRAEYPTTTLIFSGAEFHRTTEIRAFGAKSGLFGRVPTLEPASSACLGHGEGVVMRPTLLRDFHAARRFCTTSAAPVLVIGEKRLLDI